jgi:hypothetical protein
MSEKSILEQALLQVQNLEEAVKQNAKGILASTMKEELKDLLKESLEEEEDDEVMEQPETETDPEGEEEKDVTADDEETDDESDDDVDTDVDADTDLDNLDSTDDDDSDVDTGVDMENMGTDMDTDMESMGNESSMDDEDVMDMTGASDDEVLKVFKAMKPEDGIVVKKDGNNVEFGDGENEYIIKLDSEDSDLDTGMDMGADLDTDVDSDVDSDVDMSGMDTDVDADMDTEMDTDVDSDVEDEDEMEADEETIYEIELSEEDDEVEEPKKVEATEAARTKSNPHGNKNGMKRAGLPSKKMYKSGSGINEQVETLKKQNAEYKKALVLFKDKLNEVAVFNANLAYATRLFTEHTTTKQEKLNILKRFDTVSTMNEAKSLFSTIKTELGSKTTVTESVATKISNTPSSSSTGVLSESKAYENPQFSRIKEMMRKIK